MVRLVVGIVDVEVVVDVVVIALVVLVVMDELADVNR